MTRYTVTNQQATEAFLEPSPDGNWVWYSDAAAELEALQSENVTLRNAQKACEDCDAITIQEVDQLRTQNRELRECLTEARYLIAQIGTTGVERTDIIKKADKWIAELARIKEVEG